MRRAIPWAEAAVLSVTAAWGLSFVVLKWGLEDAGPFSLTALRMATGLASALILLRPRLLRATAVEWKGGIAGGVLLAGGYLLQTAGLRTAEAGTAGFVTALYVALVPFVELVVFRRVPDLRDLAVLVVCCAGIGLIAFEPGSFALTWDEGLVAISTVCWAGQIVVVGRVTSRCHGPTLVTIQLLVLAVVCGAAALVAEEAPVRWSSDFFAAVFFLGHVTCVLAFLAQAWAQRRFAPTHTAILFSPEPVFAAFFGWWLLGEAVGLRVTAGGALVLVGVLLAVLRPPPPQAPTDASTQASMQASGPADGAGNFPA